MVAMKYQCDTMPVLTPSMSEFQDPWKCIEKLGTEKGGRYAGMGCIIPPKEWNPKILPIGKIYETPRVRISINKLIK